MAESQALKFERVTLSAGAKTAVTPKRPAHEVTVVAASTGDLEMHTTDDDNLHYITISAAGMWAFPVKRHVFNPREVAFWLKATSTGEALLLWD
jgi:hypothetical protein